jgi:biotin synthase-related radical SAM superfamily protein
MQWLTFKANLLAVGAVRISGERVDSCYLSRSTAGPSAGGSGSVFFTADSRRVRVNVHPDSPIELVHLGGGAASCRIAGEEVQGSLEQVGLHCPRQAYMTISEHCIFGCRYCGVPAQAEHSKTPDECRSLVDSVRDRIDAISLTSGVADTVKAEERRTIQVVRAVRQFDLPIGVSIYPTPETPQLLANEGVTEVKWNLEAATPELFAHVCPDLDWGLMWDALRESVDLFGENRVFSNVIVGLGETDRDLEACLSALTAIGVIPVLRPLTPSGELSRYHRPSADRLVRLVRLHQNALQVAGLDTRKSTTMCTTCTGCDLVPGRDA